MRFRFFLLLASLALALLGSRATYAQAYPDQPVKIIVPLPPGTSTDITARVIGPELSKRLGVPVIIENAPGANGVIGTQKVQRAAPDGYTIGLLLGGTMTLLPHVKTLPFDPLRSFTPVAYVADIPYLLVARAEVANSIESLRALAHAKRLNFGAGANPPKAWGALLSAGGMPMQLIGYIGDPKVLLALQSGEVQVAALTKTVAQEWDGLAFLATFDQRRDSDFPKIPTLSEAGFPEEFSQMAAGIFFEGPAKLSPGIQFALAGATKESLADPAISARLRTAGVQPRFGSPNELGSYIVRQNSVWDKLVRAPVYGPAVKAVYGQH